MLAGKARAVPARPLQDKTAAACRAHVMDLRGRAAKLNDPILGILDQFPDEWRALVLWREDRDRLFCSGQCDVEHPSFLGVMELLRLRQDEVQDWVVHYF